MIKNRRYCYVGLDIGATKILATVYDAEFRPQGRARKKTKACEGPKVVLERVQKTVQEALDDAGITRRQLKGIGAGCPGPVDPEKGVIHEAPNLGWKNVPLRKALSSAFQCPAVILNDVDAGLYGEYRFGAAKGAHCALGVFPGTGIGGACVLDGVLVTGRHYSCFEIGHIIVMPEGPRCGCGQRGCLEAVASRLAISTAAAAAAYRGETPKLLALAGLDISRYGSGVLAEAVRGGDKALARIIRDAASWLGVGIATAVNLLMPDVVVLGGGLVEAMPELFLDAAGKSARDHSLTSYRNAFRIKTARLGDDATAMGAAAWMEQTATSPQRRK